MRRAGRTPVSRVFGLDRGPQSVTRYYVDAFISKHAQAIRGVVLEIGAPTYTERHGGGRVTRSDVLHVTEGNPRATIVADLTRADNIPSNTYDCIILTQTLQFIYDVPAAGRHVHRILKPGGVVLATLSGVSQISRFDMERWGEYWRFTSRSASRLFAECCPEAGITITAHGNVLAATALLYGLASRELSPDELDLRDPDYEVLITARVVKKATP